MMGELFGDELQEKDRDTFGKKVVLNINTRRHHHQWGHATVFAVESPLFELYNTFLFTRERKRKGALSESRRLFLKQSHAE